MPLVTAKQVVGSKGRGDDRAIVIASPNRVVIGVFDGAGGTGRGALAADMLCDELQRRASEARFDAVELLRACDVALMRAGSGGQSTAVVLVIESDGITGASVGDSGAWVVTPSDYRDLTQHQIRKPLIGSGDALPVGFASGMLEGTLLIATDGLLNYGDAARMKQIAMIPDIDAIPDELIASVRLRSGTLRDDVAVVICRHE